MKSIAWFFLLSCLFLLSGCVDAGVPAINGADAQEITLGVAYPVAQMDEETHFAEGLNMAIEFVNSQGGALGKPVKLHIRDDQNDATKALQIAQSFCDEGITAVVGHWSSNVCYIVEEVYDEHEMVMITPNATSLSLFERPYRYIFRMINNNEAYAKTLAQYMADQGLGTVAIVYSDDVYGNDLANLVERQLEEKGIVVADRVTSLTNANARKIHERWKAFDLEAVIIAEVMPEAGRVIERIREMDSEYLLFGTDNFDRTSFPTALNGDLDGIYMVAYDLDALDADFLKRFRDAYGHDPDVFAIAGYESVVLLCDAMNAAQTTAGPAIADYIRALSDYKSIAGRLTYDDRTQEIEGHEIYVRPVR